VASRRRYSDDNPRLTNRERLAAVDALEAIEEQLGQCAGWLDDANEVRAAAMIMDAQRSLLAACHLLQPPTPRELTTVIEQRLN
jgi:hypothetical protein